MRLSVEARWSVEESDEISQCQLELQAEAFKIAGCEKISDGVQFKGLTDSIDTGIPSGRFFFHVMASLVEMEGN